MKEIKTLNDLKEIVDAYVEEGLGDSSVGVKIHEVGVFGPTPTVGIEWLSPGFDWDSGRVIISPKISLKKTDSLAQLEEIKCYYEKAIYEYEAGLTPILDENKAFIAYLSWKQWVEYLDAISFNYQLDVADKMKLFKRNPRELRLWKEIKRGDNQEWRILKEYEDFCRIERQTKKD